MRLLNESEMAQVCGATGVCTPGNSYGGVTDTGSFGRDLVSIYEGLVSATSHVIERVANAIG
jgi:hypothetical protein